MNLLQKDYVLCDIYVANKQIYRPISSLPFISKLIKKVVARRIEKH